jgi:hypothetical protein
MMPQGPRCQKHLNRHYQKNYCHACMREERDQLRAEVDDAKLLILTDPNGKQYYDGKTLKDQIHSLVSEKDDESDRADKAEQERDKLRATIESQGRDHKVPCAMGLLCPWCEIDKLRSELAASPKPHGEPDGYKGGLLRD